VRQSFSRACRRAWGLALAASLLVAFAGAGTAEAQFLLVFGIRSLSFDEVIPGTAETLQITDVGAGQWLILGTPGAEVALTFTSLPPTILNGSTPLAITYGDAAHNTDLDPGAAVLFDPTVGAVARLGDGFFFGLLRVWLGASISTVLAQDPGWYTNDIVLDAVYTGN
jgi:hypothetical protein